MEYYVARNHTSREVRQAPFQRFFKNLCPAEMKTKEFAEKITEYEVRD